MLSVQCYPFWPHELCICANSTSTIVVSFGIFNHVESCGISLRILNHQFSPRLMHEITPFFTISLYFSLLSFALTFFLLIFFHLRFLSHYFPFFSVYIILCLFLCTFLSFLLLPFFSFFLFIFLFFAFFHFPSFFLCFFLPSLPLYFPVSSSLHSFFFLLCLSPFLFYSFSPPIWAEIPSHLCGTLLPLSVVSTLCVTLWIFVYVLFSPRSHLMLTFCYCVRKTANFISSDLGKERSIST